MASTFSSNYGFELPGDGEQSGTWDITMNAFMGSLLEAALGGTTTITMVDANYTLSTTDGAVNENRYLRIVATGTNTAQRDIIVATGKNKLFLVYNNTTGGFAVRVKTAAGTGITIPSGETAFLYADGTNVINALTSIGATAIQNSSYVYAASGGAANAYTLTLSPALTAYAGGQSFRFLANHANSGATTININSLGAKNIFKNGAACTGGEIPNGSLIDIAYDGTQFNIIGGGMVGTGSASAPGLAFGAQTGTGIFLQGGTNLSISAFGTEAVRVSLGGTSFLQGISITGDVSPNGNIIFQSTSNELRWSSSNKLISGTGTPEGAVTATVGSLFFRRDGGAGTTLYVKETGSGNTGWAAK